MLISEEYRTQQKYLHEKYEAYGTASVEFSGIVAKVVKQYDVSELLDYGAGKCRLEKALAQAGVSVEYIPYEPANELFSDPPKPAEMVACLDVLEHIEPECLDDVLDDLKRVTKRVALLTVHIGPAMKILPDGRNAHLIQQPAEWWIPKIGKRFLVKKYVPYESGFIIMCEPLDD